MEKLVHKLQKDHPELTFVAGQAVCWSPQNNHIFYSVENGEDGLLHEVGHALLGHHSYTSDVDLLSKEVDAWQEACVLATRYGITVDQEHAEDCLDTYRDWLHKRSTCPSCGTIGLQDAPKRYLCLNCHHTWHVSAARFCRPYRRSRALKNDRD
jgi:ribosomal protein S27AE